MKKNLYAVFITPILAILLAACSVPRIAVSQESIPMVIQSPAATDVLTLPTSLSTSTLEPPTQTMPAPTAPQASTPIAPGIVLVTKKIVKDVPLPAVKLNVEYPYMQEPAADTGFNQEIHALVQAQIDDLKKNAADVEDWRSKTMPQFFSELIVKYAVALADQNYAAVRLEISPFVAGAAHPNFYYLTVNYDLKKGKLLQLADLFVPGSDYLKDIAGYCKTDLEKQGVQAAFEEGLAPTEENFQNWNLTKDGLQILINPYQVDAWAAGPHKVLVPYNKLEKILLPSGPVEVLNNGM